MIYNSAKTCIIDGVNMFTKYGLIIAEINASGGVGKYDNHSEYDIELTKSRTSDIFSVTNIEQKEPIKFLFQMFRGVNEQVPFDARDIEQINRLFYDMKYSFKNFQFDGDMNYSGVLYYVKCTKFTPITVGSIIRGFEVSLITNCTHAMAFQDEIKTFELINETEIKYSDANRVVGECIPDLEIEFTSNGIFEIYNNRTNRITKIDNCISGERITFDGYTKEILSSVRNSVQLFKDYNKKPFGIVNTWNDTINELKYTGTANCKFTIKYTPSRLIGV